MKTMHPLIIVGTGLAGYTLAREYRKLDASAPVLLITADDGGFYSKPMLSNAFAQGRSAAQLVTQDAAQMAAQLNATILTGTRVTGIDTQARTIATSGGSFQYNKLVLAAGAQPIRLAIAGDAADEVLSVNHVQEYARFRQRIDAAGAQSRVAILGAGLIGCEFADDLAGAGHEATLVDPNPLPLSALAAPALSQGLRTALFARGVRLEFGTVAARVDRIENSNTLALTLANGVQLVVDVVLSAVGLRPDLRLAQAAGIATGRGILVDSHGQTSADGTYALGDCAEYAHEDGSTRVLPYVAPLMSAARAIARTLAGQPTAIDIAKPAPVIVKTPSYPLALVPPPLAVNGTWRSEQQGTRTVCRFFDGAGTLQGFGIAPQEASLRQAMLSELGKVASVAA